MDIDGISDGLLMAAFSLELHAEDRAVDTPRIEFSGTLNKILAGWSFDNPSDDILDRHGKLPFV